MNIENNFFICFTLKQLCLMCGNLKKANRGILKAILTAKEYLF